MAETLVREGHAVRIFDNFSTGKRKNLAALRGKVDVRKGDIRDRREVQSAMRGVDYVLHHAAMVSVAESVERPEETLDVNVTGTLNVLQAARRAKVRRVVMASSCAVYGAGRLPAKEDQAPHALSPYAASKLAGESLAVSFFQSYGLPVVCLRYFNVFGPRQDPSSPYSGVIAIFASRAISGGGVTVYGDGRQTRDFIYVADVVRANRLACETERAAGQVMNIGTGRGRSLLQLHSRTILPVRRAHPADLRRPALRRHLPFALRSVPRPPAARFPGAGGVPDGAGRDARLDEGRGERSGMNKSIVLLRNRYLFLADLVIIVISILISFLLRVYWSYHLPPGGSCG